MPLTHEQYVILQVLDGQSDGYLCSAKASAFVAVGMNNEEELLENLIELQNLGLVDHYMDENEVTVLKVERTTDGEVVMGNQGIVPILDSNGLVQTEVITLTVDSGWIITPTGRAALV